MFVGTWEGSLVNADHIIKVTDVENFDGLATAHLTDGSKVKVYQSELWGLTDVIVPNTQPFEAVSIELGVDDVPRYGTDSVIAWSISPDGAAKPVFLVGTAGGGISVVKTGIDEWRCFGHDHFEERSGSLDGLGEELLTTLQKQRIKTVEASKRKEK